MSCRDAIAVALILTAARTVAAPLPAGCAHAELPNGNFSQGVRFWSLPTTIANRANLDVVTGEGGDQGLRVRAALPNCAFIHSQPVPLNSRALLVRFRARGQGRLRWAQALLTADGSFVGGSGGVTTAPAVLDLNDAWTEHAMAVYVALPEAVSLKVYFRLKGASDYVVIDDVTVAYDHRTPAQIKASMVGNHRTRYVPSPEPKPAPELLHENILDNDGLLYRVTLWQGGDHLKNVVVAGGEAELDGNGCRAHAEARVQVRIDRTRPDGTHWTIDVQPSEGFGVYEVEFPLLVLNPISGPEHDRLTVPYQFGEVIRDPFSKQHRDTGGRPRLKDAIWFGTYGSKMQAMQTIMYDNGDQGIMVWTPDPAGYVKDYEVSRDTSEAYNGPGVRCSVHHFPGDTGRPGVGFTSPYPVITTEYTGGWYGAAQVYRKWAVEQRWCAKGTIPERVARGELPDWQMKNALWLGAQDVHFDHLRAWHELFPEVEIGVFLTWWPSWRTFGTDLQRYFPPNKPEAYSKLLSLQDNHRIHVFPYTNVGLYDMHAKWDWEKLRGSLIEAPPPAAVVRPDQADRLPYMQKVEEYWSTDQEKTDEIRSQIRAAWDGPVDEAILAKIASDWFVAYTYAKKKYISDLRTHWGKDETTIDALRVLYLFRPLCRDDKVWRDYYLTRLLGRNITEYGVHGSYLDTYNYGGVWICWSDAHGHPRGFGTHHLQGSWELADELRRRHPDHTVFTETIHEFSIDVVQDAYCLVPAFTKHELVPLWAAVYQGYTSLHEWRIYAKAVENLNNFAAAMAIAVHGGHKIGAFGTMTTQTALLDPKHKHWGLDYMQRLVRMKVQTMDVFAYGRRLRDPDVVNSPYHEITWFLNKPGTKTRDVIRPVIEASCWQSHSAPKRKLLLLSNSGDKSFPVTVEAADIPAGTKLTDLEGNSVIYAPDTPVAVSAFSYRALMAH
ncbi:MAG: hypothetical protein HN742_30120 [Lentisphaerae bacterium]|jgi:hypothetical protein|nr:hypothetical protein [Lentisphaerota bacterium]MBT5612698.1 hypothetical protein [Lentisphaerota bacterium]MBT7057572.1 hypothetical protein [Lentisphaerota bacterium]MBT7846167.1 hypothetical protein [Lentisphaerota bacterium]